MFSDMRFICSTGSVGGCHGRRDGLGEGHQPRSDQSFASMLTDVGETLFLRADDGIHASELWKSDGTVRVVEPQASSLFSSPYLTQLSFSALRSKPASRRRSGQANPLTAVEHHRSVTTPVMSTLSRRRRNRPDTPSLASDVTALGRAPERRRGSLPPDRVREVQLFGSPSPDQTFYVVKPPAPLSSRRRQVTVDHVRKVPLQTAHGLFVGLAPGRSRCSSGRPRPAVVGLRVCERGGPCGNHRDECRERKRCELRSHLPLPGIPLIASVGPITGTARGR